VLNILTKLVEFGVIDKELNDFITNDC